MTRTLSAGYAAGFDAGERQAFAHRREGQRLQRQARESSAYQRGWWDGYCPRTAGWAAAVRAPLLADGEVVMEVERQ